MARTDQADEGGSRWFRRRIAFAIAIAVMGVIVTGVTQRIAFLGDVRDLLIAMELVAFGIVAVETASRAIRRHYAHFYEREDIRRRSVAFQAVLRTVAYGALGVAAVAILAKSAALAVSVGSFTGVLVGLAAQNTIGNAFAGMVLAIARPFDIGDVVTVMGSTGTIVEIGAMFTRLDAGERWVLIPNNVLLSQAIQTRKRPTTP